MMNLKDLPSLTIDVINEEYVICKFNSIKNIDNGWIGVIISTSNEFIWGRFQSINHEHYLCHFIPDNRDDVNDIHIEETFCYLDSYWGERAEIILDNKRKWENETFFESDAVLLANGGWRKRNTNDKKVEMIPNGWDHEHCEICMQKISKEIESKAYTDGNIWLCTKCYNNYVLKKDLSFIYL